jgi:hypothetical protein
MKYFNKYKTLIGFLLLSIMVCLYAFLRYHPVNTDALILIQGSLYERPYHGDQGGDMPRRYIRINLKEDEKKYYIIDCAYNASDVKEILNLSANSRVILQVKEDEIDQNKLYLFSLFSQNDDSYLLTVEGYNKCYTNKWRLLVPIIILLFIIISYRIAMRIWCLMS